MCVNPAGGNGADDDERKSSQSEALLEKIVEQSESGEMQIFLHKL